MQYKVNDSFFLDMVEPESPQGFTTVTLRQGAFAEAKAPAVLTWFAKLPINQIMERIPALLPSLTQALTDGSISTLE